MHHQYSQWLEGVLQAWAAFVARNRLASALTLAALTAAALASVLMFMTINTDSSEMIDSRVPFRVNTLKMDAAFPHQTNQMVVIIRADTPDEADYAARVLADRLILDTEHFNDVFAASIDPFFERQGLLFLDLDDLMDMTGKLSSAGPLLEKLLLDPSLEQFFYQLSRVARASDEGIGLPIVAGAYDEVARVVEGVNSGEITPLSWQHMFGRDDTLNQRVLVVQPVLDFHSLQPAKAAVEALRTALSDLPESVLASTRIAITGDPVLRTEELKSVSQGIELSALVSLLLISGLLIMGLRHWQFVLTALTSLLCSIVLTAGFAALVFGALNLVSIAFTVLLIGLGIDFAIHLLLNYREQIDRGANHQGATNGALKDVGPALALAAFTTALAFFAFIPTKFVGMAQLGVISGVGVLIACVVACTLIPLMLSFLPKVRARPPLSPQGRNLKALLFRRLAIPIAVIAVFVGLLGTTQLGQVRFDADPMNLRDPDSPGVKAFQMLFDRAQDMPYRLNYLAPDLDDALEFARQAEDKPSVQKAITLGDFVPDDQDIKLAEIDFLAGDMAFVLMADGKNDPVGRARAMAARGTSEDAVAALLGGAESVALSEAGTDRGRAAARLYQALADFAPRAQADPALYDKLDGLLLRFFPMQIERLRKQMTARPVDIDSLPPDIRGRYMTEDGKARVEVLPKGDARDIQVRRVFVDEVASVSPDLSGAAFSVMRAGDVVANAMIQATLTALVLAAMLIFFMARRLGFVLMVMAPLVLAAVLTAATGVIIGLPFNFANVIVLPLLIGLGVDSAIHLVMRAEHVAEAGENAEAVFNTSTPRAVIFSALTTIGSFGSLALSSHRGTASMGELLMIAIAFTLLASLVVLPGLMQLATAISKRNAS